MRQTFSGRRADRAAVPGEHPDTERARPVSILTESGSRIAPPRLRRPAPRSAAGDGRCSYIPAPLRSLYGLVARPALSCLSDNPRSGSRAKPESVFVFTPHERDSRGAGERNQRNFASVKGSI